jgi:hypothetical protein
MSWNFTVPGTSVKSRTCTDHSANFVPPRPRRRLDLEHRSVDDRVALALAPVAIVDHERAVAVDRDRLAVPVHDRLDVVVSDRSGVAALDRRLLVDAGRAADVEGPHGSFVPGSPIGARR